jgi:hypothetical protein
VNDAGGLERRHLGVGWWGLALYVLLGAILEGLHALKSPIFVDAGRETTRMMLRLAHSHGTLVAVVNILYALTLRGRPAAVRPLASASLLAALVLLPGGFFLGAFFARGGDPGLGIVLVPVGALAVTLGAGVVARAMKS